MNINCNNSENSNFPCKNIFISTGELSGDMHAKNLIQNLQRKYPQYPINFAGMGGSAMRSVGVEIIVDSADLAIIGMLEVIYKFRQILQAMRNIKKYLRNNPPDLLILIDYPGFNLRLAKIAKKMNIKVLYYICPQLWAWHQSRAKIMQRYVDMLAVIFPFEVKFYQQLAINVVLVRHPLLDTVKTNLSANEVYKLLDLTSQHTIIGLVPGSRNNEIKFILPTILESANLIQQKIPSCQFVLPVASSLDINKIQDYLRPYQHLNIKLIQHQTYNSLSVCDAIIATSGTVTLEIALLSVPLVVVYKLTNISYWLSKLVIKIPHISLCNIVAEKEIVPELIQHQATKRNIANAIFKIIEDIDYRFKMYEELNNIKAKLEGQSDVVVNNIEDIVANLVTGMRSPSSALIIS